MNLYSPKQWGGGLLLACLITLVLSACGIAPIQHTETLPRAERQTIQHFELNGRMAITQSKDSNTVRIHWSHFPDKDLVRFSGPLGNTLAELSSTTEGARWTDSDGKTYEASNPHDLLAKLTDMSIPLDKLSHWVLGLSDSDGTLQHDEQGRLTRATDDGWTVRIMRYESNSPRALPTLLDAAGHDLHIRLVIENWQL